MNSEEQTLIDGLFSKLRQAEADSAARDTQAEARIKEHLAQQPSVPYYMTQTILVQEAAIKQLDAQGKQLAEQVAQLQAQLQQVQAQLQQAQSQQAAPAPSGGGFLSSIFGSPRDPQPQAQPSFSQPRPAAPPPSSGGWRESASSSPPPYNAPQGNYAPPPPQYQQPQAPAAPIGSGFLGGALKTAAGVAGGVMLAEGISSMFHHNQQPQEIVEVIKEEPSRANDNSNGGDNGWGNDNQRVSSNDQGGFADTDYGNDDSGFSDDDDSYV